MPTPRAPYRAESVVRPPSPRPALPASVAAAPGERRRMFAGIGAITGAVVAGVLYAREFRDDSISRTLGFLALPIPMFGGAVIGGVVGYGVGVIVDSP